MVNSIQSELTLFARERSAEIAALLRRSNDWLDAGQILCTLELRDTDSNRRLIRRCAEDLADELISGQAGYKHIDAATEDEVKHFANWMKSQGSKMTLRADRALVRKGI